MATVILPQRVPLTEDGKFISREWSRALEDLTSAITVAATTGGITVGNFIGDTGSGGAPGLVPAPGPGDAALNKYLSADGTWRTVPTSAPAPAATPLRVDDASLTIAQQTLARRLAGATTAAPPAAAVIVDEASLTLAQQALARHVPVPPIDSLPILAIQIFGA